MKKITIAFLLCSFLIGFAQARNIDAFNIKDSQFVPVFVGGWGSCDSTRSNSEKRTYGYNTPHGMFLYNQAIRYVQTINKHADKGIEKFVLICATKGSQNGMLAQGSIKTLTYTINNQDVTIPKKKAALVNIDSHQDNTYREFIRILPFFDKREHITTRLLRVADGKPLVVFGHSYGGWIAKRIIEVMAAPELYEKNQYKRDRKLFADMSSELEKYDSFPIHTFFSLEGISAVRCRITKSIQAGIQDSMGRETNLGCKDEFKSFHEELNLNETHYKQSLTLDETASKLENWYNVLLKDSKLPTRAGLSTVPSITNVILDVQPYGTPEQYDSSQAHPFKNAHHMLGFHTDTWQKLCELTFVGNEDVCNPLQDVDNKGRIKVLPKSKTSHSN